MDDDKAPIWGLLEQGVLPTTSKKDALETAIAMAYISMFLSQRDSIEPLYRNYINNYGRIRDIRMDEARSWFVGDPQSMAVIVSLYNGDRDLDVRHAELMIGQLAASNWALDLLNWVALGTKDRSMDGLVRHAPFYGILPEGQIYSVGIALPTTPWEETYPDSKVPVLRTPFWKIVNHIRQIANPEFQEVAVVSLVLENIYIQTDPLGRASGDTLITALWQDNANGMRNAGEIYNDDPTEDMAIPSVYRTDTARLTGLDWLAEVCKVSPQTGGLLSFLMYRIGSEQNELVDQVCYTNPTALSLESLSLPHFSMEAASGDDTDDSSDADATQSQTPAKGAATQDEDDDSSTDGDDSGDTTDDGSAQTPATGDGSGDDNTDLDNQSTNDTSSGDASTDATDATATAAPEPSTTLPSAEKDNIDGLSVDITGENRKDYVYRRGVLALAAQIEDDMDFPVSDEVRNLLQVFADQHLFITAIHDVKDYMKKLGLQNYLEAVSF